MLVSVTPHSPWCAQCQRGLSLTNRFIAYEPEELARCVLAPIATRQSAAVLRDKLSKFVLSRISSVTLSRVRKRGYKLLSGTLDEQYAKMPALADLLTQKVRTTGVGRAVFDPSVRVLFAFASLPRAVDSIREPCYPQGHIASCSVIDHNMQRQIYMRNQKLDHARLMRKLEPHERTTFDAAAAEASMPRIPPGNYYRGIFVVFRGASHFVEHCHGPISIDAAHGISLPGGFHYGACMKDANKHLISLAMAHLIDNESNESWGEFIRFMCTNMKVRVVAITPTGASVVRDTVPRQIDIPPPVEGGIAQPGHVKKQVLLSDLDKGLLNGSRYFGELVCSSLAEEAAQRGEPLDAEQRAVVSKIVTALGCYRHKKQTVHGAARGLFKQLHAQTSFATLRELKGA